MLWVKTSFVRNEDNCLCFRHEIILCVTDASRADGQCFERFNPTGNFNGHCGKDERTGSFAKCLPE